MSRLVHKVFELLAVLPDRPRRRIIRGFLDLAWGHYAHMTVTGREHIPEGPVLFIANHLSNSDGITLARALRPRHVYFLAGVKLQQTVMTRLGTEAVDTIQIKPGSPDIEALRRAVETLKAGKSILIFPEGARSRTGALMRGKKGVALIAQRAHVPVVPVAISGTEDLMPINDRNMGGERLRHADITVRIGAPIHVAELKALYEDAEDPRQAVTDAMMRELAALLPERYQGHYGPGGKGAAGAGEEDTTPGGATDGDGSAPAVH